MRLAAGSGTVPAVATGAGKSAPAGAVVYTVKPGDNLYDVALKFLGSGFDYHEIFELNKDRVQADGQVLTDPSIIQPGWTLIIPATVGH